MTRVIGYLRVSTEEQADSRASLEAQRAAIASEADRRGWTVEYVEDAGFSAKDLKRPGIGAALGMLAAGRADVLAVSRLDRLSRSVHDFAGLTARAGREGWSLVALDLGVDTTTPEGEMFANIRATVSQYERRLIGARTREALAARKAAGVKLGRPRVVGVEVEDRARELRASGLTYAAVGDVLASEGTLPPSGRWHPATVRKLLLRAAA